MKRTLLTLAAALSLSLGAAVAQANLPGGFVLPVQPWSPQVIVTGTITSVSDSGGKAGTFEANAYLVADGPRVPGMTPPGTAPATTPVTITLGTSTAIHVQGVTGIATVDDLQPDQTFYATTTRYRATEWPRSRPTSTPNAVFAYTPPIPTVVRRRHDHLRSEHHRFVQRQRDRAAHLVVPPAPPLARALAGRRPRLESRRKQRWQRSDVDRRLEHPPPSHRVAQRRALAHVVHAAGASHPDRRDDQHRKRHEVLGQRQRHRDCQ